MRGGEYYYPDGDGGGPVLSQGGATNGYYRDRQSRRIRLHRQNTGNITGQFLCEIPSASGMTVTLSINIGEYVQCAVTILCGLIIIPNSGYIHRSLWQQHCW